MSEKENDKPAVFEGRRIRKIFHEGEWWFAIVDVVAALTDSADPSDYLKKMRKRDSELADLLKGGDNLSPPWPGACHRRRASAYSMLEHRRHISPDSIHSQPEGRTPQTLAGADWQGAD